MPRGVRSSDEELRKKEISELEEYVEYWTPEVEKFLDGEIDRLEGAARRAKLDVTEGQILQHRQELQVARDLIRKLARLGDLKGRK